MNTDTVPKLFGLQGDAWMRHANPASVWTRFAVLPALAFAVWSRTWLGWLCLVPIVVAVAWMVVNPRFFPPPRATRNWASAGVLGERAWTEGDRATFPKEYASSAVPGVAQWLQVAGLALSTYGLVVFDPTATVAGVVVAQVAKLWYIDRVALLYAAVKS